ncbi:MAG: SUMF1/EgtB/PvdO family nonheme iron enzyme [Candidatus Cloacimonetes bacterium]|nr:SUMF1/EgtB/PvdO family nonheme iron enzyme [Candidatus Cloacimonadota bacterium]
MKTVRFILLLLLTLQIVSICAQTRLKRFEIIAKETSQFSINVDHPDCAVLSVYSAITGLKFESNMGKIKAQNYLPRESRYVIFLYPEKQKISVKCPGYIESEFPIFNNLKAKQQFSYEINEALGTQGKGNLNISSDPSGAEIIIDGVPIPNLITPRTIQDLLAMQYNVPIKSSKYRDSTFVATVNTNQDTYFKINLKPTFGELNIISMPSNARVFINEEFRGYTPLNLSGRKNGLAEGTYIVRLIAERYKESKRSLTIKAGTVTNEEVKLDPLFGGLVVNTEPSGSKVFIDGKERGVTPLVLTNVDNGLDSGTYSLKVVPISDLFAEEARTIIVQSGKTDMQEFSHVSVAAGIKIESAMKPVRAYLNGILNEELSNGRQTIVSAKEYNLKVIFIGEKYKAYYPYEEIIKISVGENRTFNPYFQSNLVSVNVSSELPYVKLSIYCQDLSSKEYEGMTGTAIEFISGSYYVIATKEGYLDYHFKLTVPAVSIAPIQLIPKNAISLMYSNESLKKPNCLLVAKLSYQEYSIKWDKVNNCDGYIIDRKNANGEWVNGIVSLHADVLAWQDKSPGSSPSYRIYSFLGNNISLSTTAKKGEEEAESTQPPNPFQLQIVPGMIYVEGGIFNMGSYYLDIFNGRGEKPLHQVTVSSFYIGKYEVTQKEWVEVMGTNPSKFKGDNLPVERVSWDDAVEYCNKRSLKENLSPCYIVKKKITICDWTASGYRLPTEAEWEFAARGGNKSKNLEYEGSHNSNSGASWAWYDKNSDNKTHVVGTTRANELGIFDMFGNVYELSWDIYGIYPSEAQTNPHKDTGRSYRVVRGGSWNVDASYCNPSSRNSDFAPYTNSFIGFRICRISGGDGD